MARERCPFPDNFRCVCRISRYVYAQRGYVDNWVECQARKDNGWYRFYEIKHHPDGREYLAGECYRPIRWKELQIAFDRGTDIQPFEQIGEDTVEIDLSGLL